MRSIANATTEQLNDIYKSSKTGASKGLLSNENFSKYKEKQFSEEMVKYLKSFPYLRDIKIASAVIEACRKRLGAKRGDVFTLLRIWYR
jgi:nucleoside diphosphate kinase